MATVYLFDLAMIPLFMAVFALYGLYRGTTRRISMSVFSDLRNIVHALMISGFLYAIVAYAAKKNYNVEALTVAKIVSMCLVAGDHRSPGPGGVLRPVGPASVGSVPVIVVGTGKLAQTVASHLRAHAQRATSSGSSTTTHSAAVTCSASSRTSPMLCRKFGVARVVVCFSRTHPERTTEMLKGLAGQVGVSIVPRYYELITGRSHVEDLSGLPMLDIAPASLSAGARFLKRSFDIVVSSVVLLVASPAFVVVAAMIKATSTGPTFFRQERTGRDEQTFSMMKFRTMVHDAESRRHELDHLNEVDGPLFKVVNDPRVTRVGRCPAEDQSR